MVQPVFSPDYVLSGDPPSKRMILKEALRLFAQKGIDGVTVRDIGASAGYTNAALFKFFPTKDAVALYLFERCYMALFDQLAAAVNAEMLFEERLRALVSTFIAHIEGDPDAVLFVQDNLRTMWPRVSRSVRRHSILALLRAALEQGVQELRVSSAVDLNLLIAAISGTLQQFARLSSFGEFRGPASNWSRQLEQILFGIASVNFDREKKQ